MKNVALALRILAALLFVSAPMAFADEPVAEPAAEPAAPVRVAKPVRNPFWPQGYEGERTAISADSVIAKPEEAATDDDAGAPVSPQGYEVTTTRHWVAARKTLKIGGTIVAKDDDGTVRTSVVINGYPYADGDMISVTHDGRRFTWRVAGLTDNSVLRLVRVRVRRDASQEKEEDQK